MSSYTNQFNNHKNFRSWLIGVANDPYYEVNRIEKKFNYDVPKITKKPERSEYGLSEDFEEQIKEEKNRIELKYEIIYILIFVLIYVIIAIVLYSRGLSIGAILGIALVYFTTGVFFINLFLEKKYNKMLNKAIYSTPLQINYQKYKNDLDAYNYWIQIKSIKYWMGLDGHQFENAVATVFRNNGYIATVSKQGGDGVIDIVIEKDNVKIAVQCKAHKNPIGPDVARDLYGTMKHFGYDSGMIVSRSGFTSGVYDFVKGKSIKLYNLTQIMGMQ